MTPDASPPVQMAAYLDGVAGEATDRPRALAAEVLAAALRERHAGTPEAMRFVEEGVGRAGDGDGELIAEIVYEIGSILVELRERFGDLPAGFLGG